MRRLRKRKIKRRRKKPKKRKRNSKRNLRVINISIERAERIVAAEVKVKASLKM
jgi:hypothetical protein